MKTLADGWTAITAMVKPGPLPGDGSDKTAERNGLILAANVLAEMLRSDPPQKIEQKLVAGRRPLDFVTCDQCRYQACDDTRNPECDPPKYADCPHAYWDSEYGTWREAEDCAPTCHVGLPKITTRSGGGPSDPTSAAAEAERTVAPRPVESGQETPVESGKEQGT